MVNVIVAAILVVAAVLAVRSMIRTKKKENPSSAAGIAQNAAAVAINWKQPPYPYTVCSENYLRCIWPSQFSLHFSAASFTVRLSMAD